MITIRDIARVCYEANRALQIVQDEPHPGMGWMLAHHSQREDAVDTVKAVIAGRSLDDSNAAMRLRSAVFSQIVLTMTGDPSFTGE